ncbi:hypothetical protein CALVIDRAFT_526134 [Calocera viscosa TUFC12733]|uniref:Uncharacterized protein n=1 Tax=Calocera viscosa (strain TUFC12733) TaxID=1330018 RepID=A0A167NZB2_CALVF|nr:hypothetical protein CALVIDRAFT_526134 [Calocera viscosa TUFC12733]
MWDIAEIALGMDEDPITVPSVLEDLSDVIVVLPCEDDRHDRYRTWQVLWKEVGQGTCNVIAHFRIQSTIDRCNLGRLGNWNRTEDGIPRASQTITVNGNGNADAWNETVHGIDLVRQYARMSTESLSMPINRTGYRYEKAPQRLTFYSQVFKKLYCRYRTIQEETQIATLINGP